MRRTPSITGTVVVHVVTLAVLVALTACARVDHAGDAAPTGGTPATTGTTTSPAGATGTLRALASARGLLIGSAVDDGALGAESDYRTVLAQQFDLVEPENVMKWATVHPAPDRYDFTGGDRLVAFAEQHAMTVRGHTLVWHDGNPSWVTDGAFTRDQAVAVLRDHIHTVVDHYRGKVAQWDVVNEPLRDDGSDRDSIWRRTIGPDYLAMAFRFAHEADPGAKLFLNESPTTAPGPKGARLVELARDLLHQGVPIDGIGLELHLSLGGFDGDGLAAEMAAIGDLGLDVAVTELDVMVKVPPTAPDVERQAELAGAVMTACLRARTCHTFDLWGFTDRHSWIPSSYPGDGAATVMDDRLRPKASFQALLDALATGPDAPAPPGGPPGGSPPTSSPP